MSLSGDPGHEPPEPVTEAGTAAGRSGRTGPKTIIYYFTGTGNTLAIARDIAAGLDSAKLVPLRRAMQGGGVIADAEVIGIAFPVHFLDLPVLVKKFIENLRFPGNPYIFGIATCGERPGPALFGLKDLLEKQGATLSAGYAFVMPENYIGPVDLTGDAPRRQEKFTRAKSRIPAITAAIRKREVSPPEGTDSGLLRIGGKIAAAFATSMYNTPRRLRATGRCNRCGTCARICPTRNITVEEDGVRWGSDCTQCYACIHWCPKEAIEIGGRTTGKARYHHPDVTIRDMLDQRGES